jgi:hypothetical protein
MRFRDHALTNQIARFCNAILYIQAVLQVVDKIPTIATQLKIIAAVKATRQGGDGETLNNDICMKHLA